MQQPVVVQHCIFLEAGLPQPGVIILQVAGLQAGYQGTADHVVCNVVCNDVPVGNHCLTRQPWLFRLQPGLHIFQERDPGRFRVLSGVNPVKHIHQICFRLFLRVIPGEPLLLTYTLGANAGVHYNAPLLAAFPDMPLQATASFRLRPGAVR